MNTRSQLILAGDIGGTKTNLAIFSSESGVRVPLAEATFASGDYPSLEALAQEFISQSEPQVSLASFGVAGPVMKGQAKITNLPWTMDEVALANALDLSSVHLLNDLLAFAHAVPELREEDLYTLNEGHAVPEGAIAVVAPGTGLGEAYLTWDGARYRAYPSEGGHADFAPANTLEAGLIEVLRRRFGHVSYERVCSGSGLPNIYAYLRDGGHGEEPAWLAEELAGSRDHTPAILTAALDDERPCELCRMTLDLFISILGAMAGNCALSFMATHGVYLGGGIPPRIIPALQKGPFMQSFCRKGRMSGLMQEIPVHVILNPKVALLGAACHGLSSLCGENRRKKA